MMLRQTVTALGLVLGLVIVASGAQGADSSPPPTLVDRWGIERDWSPDLTVFPGGPARAYVVVFLDDSCPIVTRLAPTLNELQTRYFDRRVQFLGIYSNEGLTRIEMASHKQKLDLSFPVYQDLGGRLARRLQARVTPEVFLLDADLKVLYRGLVDNSGWKKTPNQKPEAYLADALEALLSGGDMPAETRAQGCELQLPPEQRPLPSTPLTYYDHVGPVLNRHCVVCHYEGGIGGFPLDRFAAVKKKVLTVRREVEHQRMPPWQADPQRGRPVHDVRTLTTQERQLIVDWVEQGLARRAAGMSDWLIAGIEPAAGLTLPELPKNGQFSIGGGKPDYVVSMPQPFTLKASETVEYQYFWNPNEFTQDRFIQEVELLPGDRRIVHHMQVFLVDKLQRPKDVSKPLTGALMMGKLNGISGENHWRIASYVPGDQYSTRRYGSDEGMLVPAGYDVVFELHYTPIDEAATDRSSIGLVWRKSSEPPRKVLYDHLFYRAKSIEVRPHQPHVRTEFTPYFKQHVMLVDVRPHMHLRGADYQVWARYPEGREELLVAIPAYDFNWQRRYVFQEPVSLPPGSSLRVVGHWDNSRLNPYNPDPSVSVYFGEESADEMSNLVVTYYVDDEAERRALRKVTSAIAK